MGAYDNAQLEYQNTKAAFYKRANRVCEKTKQTYEDVRDTAKRAYDDAAALYKDVCDKAKDGQDAALAAAKEAYDEAKKVYKRAAGACEMLTKKTCENAQLVWNKTKNCADAAWNKGGAVCSKAKQAPKNAKEALKNEAKEALENAKQAYDEAKEALENMGDKIKENAKYIVNYKVSLADACDGVKNVAGQAANAVVDGVKTIGSWATAAWNSLCFWKSPNAEAKPAEDDQTEKLVVTCRTCGLEGESCKCGTGESRRPSLSTNGNLDKETSDLENQLRDIQLAINMTDLRKNDLDAWSDHHLRAELVQQAEKLRNEILKLQSSKLRDEYEEEQIRRFETAGKHKPRVELEPYCPEIASGSK